MSVSKHSKLYFMAGLLLAIGLLGMERPADALLLANSTGNTFLGNGIAGNVDGTVNYAVFQGSFDMAGLGLFHPGSGSPGTLDTSGYTYLFQVTNNGSNDLPISFLSVSLNGATASSWGFFEKSVFMDPKDAGGLAVDATNNLGTAEDPTPGVPRTGVTPIGFSTNDKAVDPADVVMTAGIDSASYFALPLEVYSGDTSTLIVFTLDEGPASGSALIQNNITTATGPVPGPNGVPESVPEPGTLLLLVPGMLGLAAWARRRR